MQGKSHSDINVNGKINWETNQKETRATEPITVHGDGPRRLRVVGAQCWPQNTMGNCTQFISECMEG